MLKSMTGFGRYESVTQEHKISVEIKAVNHRYLDLTIKMPKKFNFFEAAIRNLLKHYIQRGKVDLFINYEDYTEEKLCLKYNSALAGEYMACFANMEKQLGIPNDVKVSTFLRCPEVFTMDQAPEDQDQTWKVLSNAIEEAARQLVETRLAEGENLKEDLLGKLGHMACLVQSIEERSPQVMAEYKSRLEERVRELLGSSAMDEGRILTEVTIFADKVCVDEEVVRLKSHMESTRAELMAGGSMGRKLDFIAQEMNREANTILSKANDLEVSDASIALKTEIEKIREQIQNIE